MKKIIKIAFKALIIGLAAVVFCAISAETSSAASVAAPIAEFAGCGINAIGAGVGSLIGG